MQQLTHLDRLEAESIHVMSAPLGAGALMADSLRDTVDAVLASSTLISTGWTFGFGGRDIAAAPSSTWSRS